MRAAWFHNSRLRQRRPAAELARVILTLAGSEGGTGVTSVSALLVRVDQI